MGRPFVRDVVLILIYATRRLTLILHTIKTSFVCILRILGYTVAHIIYIIFFLFILIIKKVFTSWDPIQHSK